METPPFIARQADSQESVEFPIRANHPIRANRVNRFARITPLSCPKSGHKIREKKIRRPKNKKFATMTMFVLISRRPISQFWCAPGRRIKCPLHTVKRRESTNILRRMHHQSPLWCSAHQNRTIAIASDFRVDGAKSPNIPQKEGVSGSEIPA